MILLIDNREPKTLINYLYSLNISNKSTIVYQVKPLILALYYMMK